MAASHSVVKSTVVLFTGVAAVALCAAACSGGGSKGGGTGGTAGAAGTGNNNTGGSGGTGDGDAGTNGGAANGNAGTSGNSGSSGSAGAGGGPTPGIGVGGNPTDGEIGARCVTNADCREELTCAPATQDLGGSLGGTPGGWCTLPCDQAAQDMDCRALSTVATCIRYNNGTPDDMTDDQSFCSEICLLDTPPDATENKCHQRAELACWPVDIGVGFCVPSCGSDADCGDRFCDLGTGTCLDQAPAGNPIGTACDITNDQCSAFCLQFTETASSCSGTCTFGARGCGEDPLSNNPVTALCLPDVNSVGLGDLGVCLEACDCNDQCTNADTVCIPLQDPTLEGFYGRLGYCAPPFPPLVAPGGDAGSGADGGAASDPFVTGLVSCP